MSPIAAILEKKKLLNKGKSKKSKKRKEDDEQSNKENQRSSRFADVEMPVLNAKPKTIAARRTAGKAFEEWRRLRGHTQPFENMPIPHVEKMMVSYVQQIRKTNGDKYSKKSLKQMLVNTQQYINDELIKAAGASRRKDFVFCLIHASRKSNRL